MLNTIVAVDPGASGAIVVRWPSGPVKAVKMPDTLDGIVAALREAQAAGPAVLYLEDVVGNAGGTRTAQQGFSFGQGIGHLEMACLCLGIPRFDVRPQAWQKALGLGSAGTRRIGRDATPEARRQLEAANARLKKAWKARLLEQARQRYADQELRVTLWNADALLILAYAVEREIHRHA